MLDRNPLYLASSRGRRGSQQGSRSRNAETLGGCAQDAVTHRLPRTCTWDGRSKSSLHLQAASRSRGCPSSLLYSAGHSDSQILNSVWYPASSARVRLRPEATSRVSWKILRPTSSVVSFFSRIVPASLLISPFMRASGEFEPIFITGLSAQTMPVRRPLV